MKAPSLDKGAPLGTVSKVPEEKTKERNESVETFTKRVRFDGVEMPPLNGNQAPKLAPGERENWRDRSNNSENTEGRIGPPDSSTRLTRSSDPKNKDGRQEMGKFSHPPKNRNNHHNSQNSQTRQKETWNSNRKEGDKDPSRDLPPHLTIEKEKTKETESKDSDNSTWDRRNTPGLQRPFDSVRPLPLHQRASDLEKPRAENQPPKNGAV